MGKRKLLTPTDLPPDATDELRAEYEEAREAISILREAEAEVSRRREAALLFVERYELALLRHRGQMTLFEEVGDDRTHE